MESTFLINSIIMVTLTFSIVVMSAEFSRNDFATGQQYSNDELQDNVDIDEIDDAEEDKPNPINSIKEDEANIELESNEAAYNAGNENVIAANDHDDDQMKNLISDIKENVGGEAEDIEGMPQTTPSDYTCCPHSWIGFKNKCYKAYFSSKTWHDAQSYCLSKGHNGALVTILTDEVNTFVSGNVAKRKLRLWIGLNDLEYEGDFHWVGNNGHLHGYNKWNPGEPNNAGNEDCVEINVGNDHGGWNDEQCHEMRHFICERDEVDECSGCEPDE